MGAERAAAIGEGASKNVSAGAEIAESEEIKEEMTSVEAGCIVSRFAARRLEMVRVGSGWKACLLLRSEFRMALRGRDGIASIAKGKRRLESAIHGGQSTHGQSIGNEEEASVRHNRAVENGEWRVERPKEFKVSKAEAAEGCSCRTDPKKRG